MKREFTGKHMAAILVGGFAIVISVNMFMAYKATHDFGGVVVENSYVASQKYNEWLNQAEREKALGWEVSAVRDELGHGDGRRRNRGPRNHRLRRRSRPRAGLVHRP